MFTDKICNKFELKFRIEFQDYLFCEFGYLSSSESLKRFKYQGFGEGSDKNHDNVSVGLILRRNVLEYHDDRGGDWTKQDERELNGDSLNKFKSCDIIKLVFDFVGDLLEIYQGCNVLDKVSLKGDKSIIPGVGLQLEDDSIELLECNLYWCIVCARKSSVLSCLSRIFVLYHSALHLTNYNVNTLFISKRHNYVANGVAMH